MKKFKYFFKAAIVIVMVVALVSATGVATFATPKPDDYANKNVIFYHEDNCGMDDEKPLLGLMTPEELIAFYRANGLDVMHVPTRNAKGRRMVFVDVSPDKWYATAIGDATERGLMVGEDATHFNPNGHCKYGVIVPAILRQYDYSDSKIDVSYARQFQDIKEWQLPAFAVLFKIQRNDSWWGTIYEGKLYYDVDRLATRAEVAELLGVLANQYYEARPEEYPVIPVFKDTGHLNRRIQERIAYCRQFGLMVGDENGNFRPDDPITRAELAQAQVNLEKFIEAGHLTRPVFKI